MSDNDVRRLRRIIAVPTPPAPRGPNEVRQADRFQRALGGGTARRTEGRSDFGRRSEGSSLASSFERSDASASTTSADGQEAATPVHRRPVAPAMQYAADTEDVEDTQDDYRIDPQIEAWRGAQAFPTLPNDWDGALVRTVATMCQRADPSFQNWSIVVPLNPNALPETELRLTFSPHRLHLRFHTQSTRSFQLVSKHREALLSMLAEALPASREIDIDLT